MIDWISYEAPMRANQLQENLGRICGASKMKVGPPQRPWLLFVSRWWFCWCCFVVYCCFIVCEGLCLTLGLLCSTKCHFIVLQPSQQLSSCCLVSFRVMCLFLCWSVMYILRDFRNAPFYIHCLFHMINLRMFSISFFILLQNGP